MAGDLIFAETLLDLHLKFQIPRSFFVLCTQLAHRIGHLQYFSDIYTRAEEPPAVRRAAINNACLNNISHVSGSECECGAVLSGYLLSSLQIRQPSS